MLHDMSGGFQYDLCVDSTANGVVDVCFTIAGACSPCDMLQPDASAYIEYAASVLNSLHHKLSILGADQLACLLQTKAVYMPLQEPVKWRG